ncbi:hypothetical protein [Vibrio porteresiae]|uniref:Uncharacterized protein n=1 Tax=Vibrio porteresiae DSM 19223 TaxID=1123496 RepID=A0ABZ0Q7Y4_9VIBR|nr:hypothetical protein [Vibrio porteresiae]WPC72548.1 hypothetical protein R8Z52_10420 [Vibrio porteresiae DSM 19223]
MAVQVLPNSKKLTFSYMPNLALSLSAKHVASILLGSGDEPYTVIISFQPLSLSHSQFGSTYSVSSFGVPYFELTFQSYADYREFCEFYDICLQFADVPATVEGC